MTKNVTSFGRSGLQDWLIQRVTAVVFLSYVIYWLCLLYSFENLTYDLWVNVFAGTGFKVFTLLALVSLCLHAWVGMWTVYTDYIRQTALRLVLQVLTVLALLSFIIWGIFILWGINS